MNHKKVAFITGASRGIGAESAVALARQGFDVAITARTLSVGEQHNYVGREMTLPGSLESTAEAIRSVGAEALCLKADITDEASVLAATDAVVERFGRVDLIFNNAVYQGPGNQETVLDVTREQLLAIYQGNVFTPLAIIQKLLPIMKAQGGGTIINMLSYTAFNDPPASADQGGWGFAYPSSKAALGRLAGSLRAEHQGSGLHIYNMEPGTVVTEVMKAAGIDEEVLARFKPCSPSAIAAVVAWLANNEAPKEWLKDGVLHAPAIAKKLEVLQTESLLSL